MPAEVEREVLGELVHLGKVARIARRFEVRESRIRAGDVGRVMPVVVKLHDFGGNVRLEGCVVVGQLGKGVSHCSSGGAPPSAA